MNRFPANMPAPRSLNSKTLVNVTPQQLDAIIKAAKYNKLTSRSNVMGNNQLGLGQSFENLNMEHPGSNQRVVSGDQFYRSTAKPDPPVALYPRGQPLAQPRGQPLAQPRGQPLAQPRGQHYSQPAVRRSNGGGLGAKFSSLGNMPMRRGRYLSAGATLPVPVPRPPTTNTALWASDRALRPGLSSATITLASPNTPRSAYSPTRSKFQTPEDQGYEKQRYGGSKTRAYGSPCVTDVTTTLNTPSATRSGYLASTNSHHTPARLPAEGMATNRTKTQRRRNKTDNGQQAEINEIWLVPADRPPFNIPRIEPPKVMKIKTLDRIRAKKKENSANSFFSSTRHEDDITVKIKSDFEPKPLVFDTTPPVNKTEEANMNKLNRDLDNVYNQLKTLSSYLDYM